MNVKELIDILRKMPDDMEIMLPMESNVERAKAAYIAMVAKSRRKWEMAPVGNFVVLGNNEVSKCEDTAGDPFQVVIMDVDGPTWLYTDSDGRPVVIDLQQVDTLRYRCLTVPVWQAKGHSTAPFIRYSDLPADLVEAFERWQHDGKFGETPPPFHHAASFCDFIMFMSLDEDSNNTEILARYR
jgi:hypothetical protein